MSAENLRHLACRTTIALVPAAHSVWVHGSLPSQFDGARRMLQGLAEGRPDLCFLFCSSDSNTMRYLKACFPNDQASPPPLASKSVIRRFFRLANPRLLVLLGGGRTLNAASLLHTLEAGIPIVMVNVGVGDEIHPLLVEKAQRADSPIRFCTKDPEAAQRFLCLGIPPRNITVAGALDLEPGRPSQRVPRAMVRRLLGIDDSTPLLVAGTVPDDESELVLESFRVAKRRTPSARLIVDPVDPGRATALLEQARARGLRALRRTAASRTARAEAWEVLIAEIPGELPALFRGADVAVAGGTFVRSFDNDSFATALGGGCTIVAGREHVESALGDQVSENRAIFPAETSGLDSALCDALAAQRAPGASYAIHPCQQSHQGAAERTLRLLKPLLPALTRPGPEGLTWRVPTLRDSVADGLVWKAIAPWLVKRRIDDWERLGERLGRPKSILCLGNGPSCEDPRLAEVDHDCLMRVNWRWNSQDFLSRPDMVFVGDLATVQKLSSCVFGIWNESLEQRLLLSRLTRRGPRRVEYVTMTRLPGVMQARHWTARPSNGALMIVAAAALQPEHITIGGIDLFSHPAGRYPNDLQARNEYARVHTRENELAMIDFALREFQGEVTILSDILRDSLDEYRETQRKQVDVAASVTS